VLSVAWLSWTSRTLRLPMAGAHVHNVCFLRGPKHAIGTHESCHPGGCANHACNSADYQQSEGAFGARVPEPSMRAIWAVP